MGFPIFDVVVFVALISCFSFILVIFLKSLKEANERKLLMRGGKRKGIKNYH